MYYAVVLGIAQMLKLRSYAPPVAPIGIMIISLAGLLYESNMEHAADSASISPTYSFPFHFLVPVLSWLIILIRRIPHPQGSEAQ